jgi:hypothetical protein
MLSPSLFNGGKSFSLKFPKYIWPGSPVSKKCA